MNATNVVSIGTGTYENLLIEQKAQEEARKKYIAEQRRVRDEVQSAHEKEAQERVLEEDSADSGFVKEAEERVVDSGMIE